MFVMRRKGRKLEISIESPMSIFGFMPLSSSHLKVHLCAIFPLRKEWRCVLEGKRGNSLALADEEK